MASALTAPGRLRSDKPIGRGRQSGQPPSPASSSLFPLQGADMQLREKSRSLTRNRAAGPTAGVGHHEETTSGDAVPGFKELRFNSLRSGLLDWARELHGYRAPARHERSDRHAYRPRRIRGRTPPCAIQGVRPDQVMGAVTRGTSEHRTDPQSAALATPYLGPQEEGCLDQRQRGCC